MNFKFARTELIKDLSKKGIKDPRVLEALYQTPRHEFVDVTFTSRAYQDMSLPIGFQQTISQPYVVAKMTEILIQGNVLEEKPLGAVLEIGTGCGYQTAVISRFCRKIFSLERIKALSLRAEKNLKKMSWGWVVVGAAMAPRTTYRKNVIKVLPIARGPLNGVSE